MPGNYIPSEFQHRWGSAFSLVAQQESVRGVIYQNFLDSGSEFLQKIKVAVDDDSTSTPALRFLHKSAVDGMRGAMETSVLLDSHIIRRFGCDRVMLTKQVEGDSGIMIDYLAPTRVREVYTGRERTVDEIKASQFAVPPSINFVHLAVIPRSNTTGPSARSFSPNHTSSTARPAPRQSRTMPTETLEERMQRLGIKDEGQAPVISYTKRTVPEPVQLDDGIRVSAAKAPEPPKKQQIVYSEAALGVLRYHRLENSSLEDAIQSVTVKLQEVKAKVKAAASSSNSEVLRKRIETKEIELSRKEREFAQIKRQYNSSSSQYKKKERECNDIKTKIDQFKGLLVTDPDVSLYQQHIDVLKQEQRLLARK